jgi:hypothetical protein
MYNLFTHVPTNRAASYTYPVFTYIQRTMSTDIDKLINYRRANPKAVKSDHLLVRTLQSINIPYDGNLEIYRGYVEARTAQFTGGLGYTSNLYKGKPFHGRSAAFYGGKTVEIIIATEDDFNLKKAKVEWMDWRPVRVLAHPRSDISIETIDGTNKFSESGICVIEVNIPMLACQYQMWKETQRQAGVEVEQDVRHFVTAFPLTNAIYSHLDISIFNRLSRRLFKEKVGQAERAVPFYTVNFERQIDSHCKDMIERFVKNSLNWDDILRNIPSLKDGDMLNVHRLPKMVRSNQVIWAMVAARLNLISFLVKLRDKAKHYTSVDEVIELRRSLITIESGKLLTSGLPATLSTYFEKFIENRIEYYL